MTVPKRSFIKYTPGLCGSWLSLSRICSVAGTVAVCQKSRRIERGEDWPSGLDEPEHARFLSALTLGFIEELLAQAQVLGRGLNVFVQVDVFQRPFQAELERGLELDAFAVALGTHVGQFLFLDRVDRDVVLTGVFANDHADVN